MPRGVDRGADDPDLVAGRNHLKQAALQRAHLHHLVQEIVQQVGIDESRVGARDEELPGAFQMNAGGGGRGQGAMPSGDELSATGITPPGIVKDFFRLQVQKPAPHGPVAHDAFQVPHASAAAELLFGVECHNGVPALPGAFRPGVAPEADAVAQGPHADELIELSSGSGDSGRHDVRVVEDESRHGPVFLPKRRR